MENPNVTIVDKCGTAIWDFVTLSAFTKAAERDRLKVNLQMTFPDEWEVLLQTMDAFDRASARIISPYIQQMWLHGVCSPEETMSLYSNCPAAFRGVNMGDVVGAPANVILPKLAENLQ